MRRDKNYGRAVSQIGERLAFASGLIDDATRYMLEDRPQDAWDVLSDAKNAIEGAMTTAKWATTLAEPKDEG